MSEHTVTICWIRRDPDFVHGRYSREHSWRFDGGITVPASPALSSVPPPYSNPAAVDPEEAFVASVSSCHMLTFLSLASKQGLIVDRYEDRAVGHMTKNQRGVPWVSSIQLDPQIAFGGERQPTPDQVAALHHSAHDQCFIAASIRTEVTVGRVAHA